MFTHVQGYSTIHYNFSAIHLEDSIVSREWELTIGIAPATMSVDDSNIDAEIQKQKVIFWLDTALDNPVFVDMHDPRLSSVFQDYGNTIVGMPGAPSDDRIIARVLHSKISTLVATSMVIADIVVRDKSSLMSYTFGCNEGESYGLPVQSDLLADAALWPVCWWERYDMDTFDLAITSEEEAEEKSEIQKNASTKHILDQFEHELKEQFGVEPVEAEIIDFDEHRKQSRSVRKEISDDSAGD